MATAGGTPPTGVTTKTKREVSPLLKFGLPVAAGLALIVGYLNFPRGSSSTPVPASTAPRALSNTATTIPTPVPLGASRVAVAIPGTTTAPGTVPIAFVARARTDPFEQMLLYPPVPTPEPPPPPAPKPPPPPVSVPSPADFAQNAPVSIADPRVQAEVAQPLNIGSPRISRTIEGAPRDAFPLPRTSGSGGEAGTGAPQQSYDKRLAGVIIGDGVRALLEITSNGQITTQVVQPGDEVNGVRVLSIDRVREGDRTVTRMLVRDTDGTQRIVDLKASSQPPAGTGTAGGFPGAPGGFPGAPGAFRRG